MLVSQMSTTEPTRIERRCGQRFAEFQVPVLLRAADGRTGSGGLHGGECEGERLEVLLSRCLGFFTGADRADKCVQASLSVDVFDLR